MEIYAVSCVDLQLLLSVLDYPQVCSGPTACFLKDLQDRKRSKKLNMAVSLGHFIVILAILLSVNDTNILNRPAAVSNSV